MKLIKKDKNEFGADWLKANMHSYDIGKTTSAIEKEINQYITLKLEHGRTFIYVNGKRFIQCIRLILNIPKSDIHLYDEIDSIDEAAKLYESHLYQNRVIRAHIGEHLPRNIQNITPEQEFWGHCSNIQAWVEHDYDTRILMTNISFPLLRELTKAGDPKAKRVYKEEIALRLESGYPSVVQYLLTQRYIEVFNPEEFKTILETTKLIENLSSDSKMLAQFLRSCIVKFPTLLEDILIQILKLPKGKNLFLSIFQIKPDISTSRTYLLYNNPQFLFILKNALENVFNRVDKKVGEDILDCIQKINSKLENQPFSIPNLSGKSYLEVLRNLMMKNAPLDEFDGLQELLFRFRNLELDRRGQSRCSYCGRLIPKNQDICEWCGHKKDDDEGGFFPFPFIFKPPGGGGGGRLKEGAIVVPIRA